MQKDIAGCWLFPIVLGLRPPQVFVFVKQVSLFAKGVQDRTEHCERGRWKPNQLAVLDDHSCTNHETHRLNCVGLYFFPESVWAQGSSNSGGLYLIFTPSHLHTFSHTFFLIFTSAHLHICSSSHLLIFTSSHLLIFTSSHLHIFTPSHLHIFSSSHLLIFTSSHLHIFSLSLTLSPLSSLLSLSPFSLSCLSPFSLSRLLYLSLFRPRVFPTGSHETSTRPFRAKWGSIVKNWGKIAILLVPEQPFRTKGGSRRKNWGKIAILLLLVPDLSWSNVFEEMRVDAQKLR